MRITEAFLKKWAACSDGREWLDEVYKGGLNHLCIINALMIDGSIEKLQWANWLLPRCLGYKRSAAWSAAFIRILNYGLTL